jgi:hypothetical protein
MPTRDFSAQLNEEQPGHRRIEDAPEALRHEFIDLAFHVFERAMDVDERRLHQIIVQSLGGYPSGQPYGGPRRECSREISRAQWPRVYDLICRLWVELPGPLRDEYRTGVNRILAGHQVAWDLGEDGQMHRVLPPAADVQIDAAFRELNQPRFAAALTLLREAMNAYDDRPQRGREACANIFDSLESVAKEVFGMPTATFGNVLTEARRRQSMVGETVSALQKLYDMANGHFRHGMTIPFTLQLAEVDFVLISCIAGILLFVRLELRSPH